MIRRVFLAGFAALLAIVPVRAQESNAFDCVIEPSVVSELGSTADGLIEALMVKRGDVVAAGEPIAQLRSDTEKAALALAKSRAESSFAVEIAKSRAEVLKNEADRQRTLYDRKVSSIAVLEQALNAAAEAALELQQAEHERDLAVLEFKRSEIALGLRTITSPIDGVVMQLMMMPGEYVYEQAKIAQIARMDPLHVEVYLPISLYNNVRLGMEAEVQPADPIGGVHRAKVIAVDKVFDSASDTFGVRLELPNPGSVMPAGINCGVTFQSS